MYLTQCFVQDRCAQKASATTLTRTKVSQNAQFPVLVVFIGNGCRAETTQTQY